MKNRLWIILLISLSMSVYSRENCAIIYSNGLQSVSIDDASGSISYVDEVTEKKEFLKWNIEYISKLPYLVNDHERRLVLFSEDILLIYKKGKQCPYFFGTNNSFERFYKISEIRSETWLIEGSIEYFPAWLSDYCLEKPWVEGVPGLGIGSKIYLDDINAQNLYISLGYVSFTKPHLYEDNGRPKKIRISDENLIDTTIILEDTPNPQKIKLGWVENSRNIVIEIVEVYPGKRFSDTCINFIIPEA